MKKILILAGGRGTRLAPYTTVLPKPLMPIGKTTILESLLSSLGNENLTNVTISIGYLGYLIQAVIGNGEKYGVSVDYVSEDEPLGTAGPLRLLKDLKENDYVLVINGDTFTDFSYEVAFQKIEQAQADALILGVLRKHQIDYGILEVDDNFRLLSIIEKPVSEYLVSTGINVILAKCINKYLRPGRVDMPDFLREIAEITQNVICLQTDSKWLDLGRPEDLAKANDI